MNWMKNPKDGSFQAEGCPYQILRTPDHRYAVENCTGERVCKGTLRMCKEYVSDRFQELQSAPVELPKSEPMPSAESRTAGPPFWMAVPPGLRQRRSNPPPRDVQKLVNDLVWRCGNNVRARADREELYTEAGVSKEEVTSERVEAADKWVCGQLKKGREQPPALLEWGPPCQAPSALGDGSSHEIWWSTCGLYRIARIGGAEPRFTALAKLEGGTARERIIADDLKTLCEAFARVEDYHRATLGRAGAVGGNAAQTLKGACGAGLDRRPRRISKLAASDNAMASQTEGRTEMQVNEEAARAMFAEMLGEDVAASWTAKRLSSKLNKVHEVAKEEDVKEPTGANRKLFDEVSAAVTEGAPVTLEGKPEAAPVETNGSPEPETTEKKPRTKRAGRPSTEVKDGEFTRMYKGKEITVRAEDGAFVWGKKKFPSLTAVAREVTGYKNISGPHFFKIGKWERGA